MKRFFRFDELNTSYRTEIIAGVTTFLAMAYILFVNPNVLSLQGIPDNALPGSGRMDPGAIFTATAIASAIGTLIMGLFAKLPIALAPGMGLNAFFAFTVVLTYQIPWETALAGVFASGVIFMILSLSGLRELLINAIPPNLKLAMGAGIGLFIAFIGLKNANLVVASEDTVVALGDITSGPVLLTVFGVFVTALLLVKGLRAAIFIGMLITAVAGMVAGLIAPPTAVNDVVGSVPSLAPTFGAAFDHFGDIFTIQMLTVILTFLFVDFFDTAGTLVAVATKAGLMKDGKLPNPGKALLADSGATVAGAIIGTSNTTAYVESTTGVGAGGRSGFTAVVTAICFLLALFFSPLLSVITNEVTAPALIVVGVLMCSSLKEIEWDKVEFAVPAFFTILMMPLTASIATGIAIGFIFYPLTLLVKGRVKEVHPVMWFLFVIFILYFIYLA